VRSGTAALARPFGVIVCLARPVLRRGRRIALPRVLAFIAPAGIAAERFHKMLQQALLLLEPRRERAHGFFVARAALLLGSVAR